MNRWCVFFSCAVLLGLLAGVGAAEPPAVPRYDARTFFATTAYFGASFSADEKHVLITSDATGVFNAFSIAVEGGEPAPLTNSKTNAAFGVGYFPNDDRILYTEDQGGNELNHLYVRETDGKAAT